MNDDLARKIQEDLAAPFPPEDVHWKPQAVKDNRAMAIAYINARAVQDRLDDVVGVMGWQDSYQCMDGGSVMCSLSIRVGNEWVTKMDVGGESEQPDGGDRRKAAVSDALKRVAVKFGIGRYLYKLPSQWVDYDPQRKRLLKMPQLPEWALPKQKRSEPTQQGNGAVRLSPCFVRIQERDAELATEGISKPGDLVKHLRTAGENAGTPRIETWEKDLWIFAKDEIAKFEILYRARKELQSGKANQAHFNMLARMCTARDVHLFDVYKECGIPESTDIPKLTPAQWEKAVNHLLALPEKPAQPQHADEYAEGEIPI